MSKVYECDATGDCPFLENDDVTCQACQYCHENEHEDDEDIYPDDADETNYNPYMGCDDYECDRDGDGLDF